MSQTLYQALTTQQILAMGQKNESDMTGRWMVTDMDSTSFK